MKNAAGETQQVDQPGEEKSFVTYLGKMRGGRSHDLPRMSLHSLFITALGSFSGVGLVALLSAHYHLPLLVPFFGASAVLLYGAWNAPMAQPRNVIGGHVISALVGVLVYQLLGNSWWTVTLGVTLAILAMTVTYTLHPPGGATAFMAVYNEQSFDFILSPVGLGALCLVLIAVLINNLSSERRYPYYWL